MNSRERILEAVKKNQPEGSPLPSLDYERTNADVVEEFKKVLTSIGGVVVEVKTWDEVRSNIEKNFSGTNRIISVIPELDDEKNNFHIAPQLLENVKLAILPGKFGVAENGAIWITGDAMGDRALPFITEHLSLIIQKENIVATMHQAYERIGPDTYNFGTFIAGPSKTADIEQSLVLGAHGAKSLVVFLMSSKTMK